MFVIVQDEEYVVCGILDKKDAEELYLIKWMDLTVTWEHKSNLDGCLDLLEEFLKVKTVL